MDTVEPLALPPPIPDKGDKPEAAIRALLAKQAQELVELTASGIAKDPLRTLSIIETYSASMRTVLADLDESPAPRRQRRGSNYQMNGNVGYGPAVADIPDFDPGPPGVTGDFMGSLSAMIEKQTNSQAAGHASSEIRNFAVALEALGDDDPLRVQVRAQLADRLAALEPIALEPYDVAPGTPPTVVIETGVPDPLPPCDVGDCPNPRRSADPTIHYCTDHAVTVENIDVPAGPPHFPHPEAS